MFRLAAAPPFDNGWSGVRTVLVGGVLGRVAVVILIAALVPCAVGHRVDALALGQGPQLVRRRVWSLIGGPAAV